MALAKSRYISHPWEGDQDCYRCRFQLDGDFLHILVNQLRESLFSATCSLRPAATRTAAASRLAVTEDAQHPNGGDSVRRDIGYHQLSALLDARKSTR